MAIHWKSLRVVVTSLMCFCCLMGAAQAQVADYRLDELAWNGISDEVVNTVTGGIAGTAVNGAGTSPGKLCKAGTFNGTDQYVRVNGLNNLLSGTASMSFWIKTTQVGNDTMWQAPGVAGVEESGGGNDVFWGWLDANGRIGVMKGNVDGAKSTVSINNGQWRHVVLSRNASSGQTKVYVDGGLQSTATSETGVVTTAFSSIGRLEVTSGAPIYFAGALDEVKIYSTVLTDTQALAIFNNESAGKNYDASTRTCPSALTCVGDTFATGTLDAALWNVAGVGYTPQVVSSPTVTSNRLRLTDNSGNRSTFAQLKKWFPGANNKVVVEFDFFAWGSNSGADGVSMVLSDASVAPTPGGFGGSLGYANRSGGDGFGGGWLGIGLDEFGNFPGNGEGRRGYPAGYTAPAGAAVAAGFARNSISVRGSGSGQSAGYALLANTGTLATAVQTGTNTTDSTTKHRYRVTMDHSNSVNAFVSVERDTTGTGSSFTTVIPAFDIKVAAAGQAPVPENMLLSFTGSTGGSTNNHEIANVRVCASTINPVGGNAAAVNFECMDAFLSESAYVNRQTNPSGRNPTFTKLARTPFKLRLVPLASNGSVKTDYVTAGGSSRNVTVELFDDNTTPAPVCSAYSATNLAATQSVTLSSGVAFLTDNITVNKAYTKLRCRVTDNAVAGSPVYGCGSDQFAVRPGAVTLSTSATAAAPSASAGPTIKAGANFNVRATTSTSSTDQYAGTLTQNTAVLSAQDTSQDTSQVNGGVVGTLTPASLVGNAPSTSATYTEAGYLYLAAGAYLDTTYTAVDQPGDCVGGSTSVALSSGKYGCVIGTTAAVSLGRFIPDRFAITPGAVVPACRVHPAASPGYTPTDFTYFSQPEGFTTPFTLRALNVSGNPTQNYAGAFARISSWNSATATSSWAWNGTSSATGLRFGTAPALPIGSSLAAAVVSGVPVTPIGAWASGVAALSMVQHQVSRPTALTGETAVTITALPIDPDGVTLSGAVAVSSSATPLRWGRVRMQNAYGSERLALAMPIQSQIYDAGTGTFKANPDDSCTPLTVPIARTLSGSAVPDGVPNQYFYPAAGKNQLLASDTTASLKTTTGGNATGLTGGAAVLSFTAPSLARPTANTSGWLDLILGVPSYLQANWNNCMGQTGAGLHDDLPCARVTFGVFKSPLIYRRENY